MRANCPQCNTAYNVDDAKIPPTGAKLKCAKCATTFPISKGGAAAGAVPLPGTPGQAPVPLPGQAGPRAPAGGAVPLPGSPGAVPLPGQAAPQAGAAVPLPGQAAPRAAQGAAVPLPGSPGGAAVPLPGTGGTPRAGGPAVPLPAGPQNVVDPYAQDLDDLMGAQAPQDRTVAISAPQELQKDSPTQSAVDLNDPGADPFALDFGDLPPPPPAPPAAPPTRTPVAPMTMAPPAPADPGADADPFAMDFGEPPPPPAAPRPPSIPAPAAPRADPGADADPFAMDFGAPPPAAPARPLSLSNVGPPADDNLEFDPTAPAPARPPDDLEADLSAPLAPAAPAVQPAGDDLELLDFIDDAEAQAKSKSKGKVGKKFDGYQVRNRAGKIFGPMAEGDVVRMLAEGKILGNEEISRDGENWVAFGSHLPFAEALQKLMEAPGGLPGAGGGELGLDPGAPAAVDVNERIKQIYGGRMAGIVIVDSAESIKKIKKRLPFIIAGAVAALGVAFGVYLGFTPYGFFGVRRLFPKVIKPGSAEYKLIEDGEVQLAHASFPSLKKAQADADKVLGENDQFLNARALYAQAAFALKEHYGVNAPEALARAHRYVEEMKVAQPNDPDVIATEAAEALLLGNAAELRPQLEKALKELTKKRPQGAAAIALELAESYAKDKQDAKVRGYFDQADNLGSSHVGALTAHAGYLAGPAHDPQTAAKLLEKALQEAPDDGPAALALANLRVGPLADPDHVEELFKPFLDQKDALSDEEQGRMHAILGMVRVYQKRNPEAEAEFKQALKLASKSAPVEGAYGAYLVKRGLFDQAEPLFQDAYNQQPDDLEFVDGLVLAMVGNGHQLAAEKLVADAKRRWPKSARVALLDGVVSEGEDKLLEAEDKYKAAIKLDPKLTRADLRLSRVYLRDGKLKEAHTTLEDALKKSPQDPAINTAWGELAMAENRVDDALQIFDEALKLDNDSARTHLGRARALLAKSQLPDAEKEARTAISQDEHLVGTHKVLGDVLFAEGQFDKAGDEYDAALKQDEKDSDAYLMKGRALFNLGDYDGAQTAFDAARTLASATYKPYYWLALAHLRKHEITQAIESMNKALDNGGQNDPEVHYNFGLVYKAGDGHYNDALDEFKQALKLRPTYVEALESLGDALNDANDYKGAQGYYEQAYATDPKRTEMLGKIGLMYFKQQQYPKAIDAYKRHLAADATSVADYERIGDCYNEMGKKKDAATAYREATSKDAKNAQAWEKLGYVLKEENDNRAACKAFKEYEKVNPKAEDKKDIDLEIDSLCGSGG